MRLTDLEPRFLKLSSPTTFSKVETVAEADGLWLLCPKCFQANGGSVGTHAVICWRPTVPQDIEPKPGRWDMKGTGFNDLTLVAKSSSILLLSGCKAHFFIRDGGIQLCQ